MAAFVTEVKLPTRLTPRRSSGTVAEDDKGSGPSCYDQVRRRVLINQADFYIVQDLSLSEDSCLLETTSTICQQH